MSRVFLLGAGFTRAVLGLKAPLTDEIMPKLNLSSFPEIIEDYEKTFPDIEQFITQLDLKCLRFEKSNESLSKRFNEIRANIVEQIVRMFDIDILSVDSLDKFPTLKIFIDIVPANSTILTLNYDLVLDQGLWCSGKWTPCGGYHVPHLKACDADDENNDSLDKIPLLKLHGSCNFRENLSSREDFFPEITDAIFPSIHLDSNSRGTSIDVVGPHVLVMSYLKIYHKGIMKLWKKAIEDLINADRLTIIGCSLREEDTFLRYALYHFGRRKNVTKLLIDVVDVEKDICDKVADKVQLLCPWPKNHKINKFNSGLKGYLSA